MSARTRFKTLLKSAAQSALPEPLYAQLSIVYHHGLAGLAHVYAQKRVGAPPADIPQDKRGEFTMGGTVPVLYWYLDDRAFCPVYNSKETYEAVFAQLDAGTFEYYGKEGLSFYGALSRYGLAGKTVLVFGLAGCNCEAMAVWKGAELVYVVDYNKPKCEHERVTVLSMEEFRAGGVKVDAAFSFSSFEHDGLGRYGDPVSPDADISAMKLARDVVKPGGLMFFGVPLGSDCLVWNAHRVYGRKRLPLMLDGWTVEDAYYFNDMDDILGGELGAYRQPLLVLKNERPKREAVLAKLERERERERERELLLGSSYFTRCAGRAA
ncbi:MAG: DUF268 domain-containing protein [Synergistaceae bacterium]|jgi:hypothetical protein|nr:DUF268 domain-containing protein [Synergistaceae bacterium]